MNEYLLLRENEQSGPYCIDSLASLGLKSLDLVWVEGESERWEPITDRPELAAFIVQEPRKAPIVTTARAQVSLPEPPPVAPEVPVRIRQPRPFQFRAASRPVAGGLWILALFGCLVGGAVVVQKIIENGNALAHSSAYAFSGGLPPAQAEGSSDQAPAGFQYQNALKTESVSIAAAPGKAPAATNLHDLRRVITISTNTDKEGLFDGISDLQVRVANNSDHTIDQVNLEVSVQKPGNAHVQRETYSVNDVAPHSAKILVMPPAPRGAHVHYKLQGVQAKALTQTPA